VTATARRERGHVALWAAVAVGLVLALFVAVLATRKSAANQEAATPLAGRPAPPISGRTIDGGTVDLTADGGRWVLVNFFATWCVPCRDEQPELVLFQKRHQRAGDATVLSVTYSTSTADARSFFRTHGGDWPVLDDPSGRVALDYGVRGVPESFLIAPNGVVVTRITGGVTADGLDALLARVSR
jgi:cytochrome c biogenesis protein CcmG, thiol:disulfide interchange protein DsbE